MCRKVNSRAVNNERNKCGTAHRTPYSRCEKEVIYSIPLSCGKCYIGQTGRCINDRTREHAASVKALTAAGHLPAHCRVCQCTPDFHHINIVARHRTQLGREILEAMAIDAKKDECVSAASIALYPKEKSYLEKTKPED